jgi:hypothetical protein
MARSGQALVEQHFGFERFAAIVAKALNDHRSSADG